jgi:hypothetical protein
MNTNDIPIASPCGQDWRTMKAGDRGRYCDACKKTVHDLSAMTRSEARALLESPPTEGLCVRYIHDVHGAIAFRDTVPATRLVRARRALAAVAAMALPMSLAACMGAPAQPLMGSPTAPSNPPQEPMMGAVALPPQPQRPPDAGPVTPEQPVAQPVTPEQPVTPVAPPREDH